MPEATAWALEPAASQVAVAASAAAASACGRMRLSTLLCGPACGNPSVAWGAGRAQPTLPRGVAVRPGSPRAAAGRCGVGGNGSRTEGRATALPGCGMDLAGTPAVLATAGSLAATCMGRGTGGRGPHPPIARAGALPLTGGSGCGGAGAGDHGERSTG
eukprot:15484613-Alexandrium_andersonii.AAC.1